MRTYSNSSGESPLCWRFTNWIISGGDIENSITFESSSDSQETVDSSPMSTPLFLKPPTPDSGPCEIQLSFSQKYEIRQIYVRSTARVYEIYYSQSEQSGNEYLCTVRCSLAEREGEVLKAFDFGSSADTRECSGDIIQEKFASEGNSATSEEGNSATSEDDWVKVRAFGSEIQDLYEATAEINDSDSCTSVTIRLLSLQNKGCVCIDEVYIYADPVISNEPENQLNPVNSSTESSLMSLLVPTILQLSRSNNTSQSQSQQASHEVKNNQLEARSKTDDSINAVFEPGSRNQIEAKTILPNSTNSVEGIIGNQDINGVTEQTSVSLQDANESTVDENTRSSDSRVEKLLEQLLCRVNKIEEVCLRFEESMVKPMKNMETRIQQVEEQLNLLAKDSQYSSGLPQCRRFSAPSFSCDSNSSSYQPRDSNEFEKKEFTFSNLKSCGSDEFENKDFTISNSVNGPDLSKPIHDSPGEISIRSEDYVGELKSSQDCSEQNPKRIFIDDLLAASLSGLVTESSCHSLKDKQQSTNVASDTNKNLLEEEEEDLTSAVESCGEDRVAYTKTFTVFTAPEFTISENGNDEYSDFQFAPLRTSVIELEKDSVYNSVPSNPLNILESSSSLVDLDSILDFKYFNIDYSTVHAPIEAIVDDKEEIKAVSNHYPCFETGYSFDMFKDIEAIEPLTCKNIFSGTGTGTGTSEVIGSSIGDSSVSLNQDTVISLI